MKKVPPIPTPDQALVGTSGGGTAVSGSSTTGTGILGQSTSGRGVWGQSEFIATVGDSTNGTGIWGRSVNGVGVYGVSQNGPAGHFEGDVEVTGDIRLKNEDCAEEFQVSEGVSLDPGSVVVFDEMGVVVQSQHAYDKKVAGVVSGAGEFKPAIILGKQDSAQNRVPIALLGKVYCKADAQYGAISVGDLLTTSATPGHAMKAQDPLKAFGAVLGKALRRLDVGQASIPILVSLQ